MLVGLLQGPLSFLYRLEVDRQVPNPASAPPRDFIAVALDPGLVDQALVDCGGLVYGDARAEVWIRGGLNEQVVLDRDGMVFCYPDDPCFRDALEASGVPEASVETIADRDYVKHWFHSNHDAMEDDLKRRLNLVEVAPRD